MQTSKLDNAKGVPFLNRRYIKGVLFCQKMVYILRVLRDWISGQNLPV